MPGGTSWHGDAGLVEIAPTSFWNKSLAPIIVNWTAGEEHYNERYAIYGTMYNPQKMRGKFVVCHVGISLGGHAGECGLAEGFIDVTYGEGAEVRELENLNVCPPGIKKGKLMAGSSGGPAFKRHYALGVNSGSDNGCHFYYSGINSAASALHVQLMTAPTG